MVAVAAALNVNEVKLSTLTTVVPAEIPVPEIVIPGINAAVLVAVTVGDPNAVTAAVTVPEINAVADAAKFPLKTIGIPAGFIVVGSVRMLLPEVVEHPEIVCVPTQPSAGRFNVTCVPLSTDAICVPDGNPYPYNAIPSANPAVLSTVTVLEPKRIPVTVSDGTFPTHHVFTIDVPVAAVERITVLESTTDSITAPFGMFAKVKEGNTPPHTIGIPATKPAVLGTRATRDPIIVSTGYSVPKLSGFDVITVPSPKLPSEFTPHDHTLPSVFVAITCVAVTEILSQSVSDPTRIASG